MRLGDAQNLFLYSPLPRLWRFQFRPFYTINIKHELLSSVWKTPQILIIILPNNKQCTGTFSGQSSICLLQMWPIWHSSAFLGERCYCPFSPLDACLGRKGKIKPSPRRNNNATILSFRGIYLRLCVLKQKWEEKDAAAHNSPNLSGNQTGGGEMRRKGICTWQNKCVCMHVRTHVCVCVYMCVLMCLILCVSMCVCVSACVCMHVYMCVQCVWLCVCVSVHIVWVHVYMCVYLSIEARGW